MEVKNFMGDEERKLSSVFLRFTSFGVFLILLHRTGQPPFKENCDDDVPSADALCVNGRWQLGPVVVSPGGRLSLVISRCLTLRKFRIWR